MSDRDSHTDDDVRLSENEIEAARQDREGLEWLAQERRSAIETVQPDGPASTRRISDEAFDLIVEFEVSSQQVYTARYRKPVWPQGASGVTVGVGYDVGYATKALLHADFDGAIPAGMVSALERALGVTGTPAAALAESLRSEVDVPWDAAIAVHRDKVVPRWTGVAERALQNTSALPPSSLGALVSLIYNRGASFSRQGDRYAEMRRIREHMAARDFEAVPGDIRSMKRLWPTVPGLQKRREREARLFEVGLAGA